MNKLFILLALVVAAVAVAAPEPSTCITMNEDDYNAALKDGSLRKICLSLWAKGGYREPVESGWTREFVGTKVVMRYEISAKQSQQTITPTVASNMLSAAKIKVASIAICQTNDVKQLVADRSKVLWTPDELAEKPAAELIGQPVEEPVTEEVK
jgi:hypothetical protein